MTPLLIAGLYIFAASVFAGVVIARVPSTRHLTLFLASIFWPLSLGAILGVLIAAELSDMGS